MADEESLLDGILAEHAIADVKAAVEEARQRKVTPEAAVEPAPSPAKAADSPPEFELKRRPYAADPRHNIFGLMPGAKFEMSDCGPDMDGLWVVVKVNGEDPDPAVRNLVAARDGVGPPYLKMTEEVLREELDVGRLALR
ncbi:MAG: hypothetical protein KC620_20240 [Myxococcales bacterium]|nr:hypothetical protein [Myxococcales bacterium]